MVFKEAAGTWPSRHTGPSARPIPHPGDALQHACGIAEGRYIYAPQGWLCGSRAWGHQFEDQGSAVSGELIGLFDIGAPETPLDENWLEATLGLRHGLGTSGALTASATFNAAGEDHPRTIGHVGLSQRF